MDMGDALEPGALPRSTPSREQVDPAAVLGLLDALDADPDVEMHSLMVVRHGRVVAEGWWSPYAAERPQLLYSLSKSFTATAVGIAQAEGLLDLDDPVVAHFPEIDPETLPAPSVRMTLRHLAMMASGHTEDAIDRALARDPENPVRGFLLTPPEREPGTVFAYNQPCTYTLAAVVQRRSGLSLTQYLRPRLLDPLGIGEVGWASWPSIGEVGFTGLHARTEDVAKLGLLHLQRGRWGDRQLVPQEWVDQATTRRIDNPSQPNPDWRQGYGYQFWMARHGYRGDGAFGQFCVVLPEHDTVVAATAATEAMQSVLDAMWQHLLPGLGVVGPDPATEEWLRSRLSDLQLPACQSGAGRPDRARWAAEPSTVVRGPGGRAPAALSSVAVDPERSVLTLTEADNELPVAFGHGEWLVSEPLDAQGGHVPVAASGSWDGETLHVEVVFLETPHRLDVTLTLPARTAVAAWRLAPLGPDRLQDLRCP